MAVNPGMLGEFELRVLLAVVRLGEEAYGASILKEIADRTRRPVARGSVYITLDRLEAKGFLSSERGDPTPIRGGRSKRFFKLRPKGLRLLRQTLADLGRLQEGLGPLLEGA
ncbi:MAG: PadR family transcriptional regulator [Vicinamibacteria bacterium]